MKILTNPRFIGMVAAWTCFVSSTASANDSVAEMWAGGLVLGRSADIEMRSEDLYISAEQVRVDYLFVNRSMRPVRTIVAFPLPDRDLSRGREQDTTYPTDFHTLVGGRPVNMSVERRAFLNGAEQTPFLAKLYVPLVEDERGSQARRLADLAVVDRRRLEQAGLVATERLASGLAFHALWTVREIWHWLQIFPSWTPVRIEHSYRPAVGGTAGVPLADRAYRASPEGRETAAEHCADPTFFTALDRMAARQGKRGYLVERRIGYILSTGDNWAGPIRDFRLIVDKGNADAIVSFCGQGVRRVSPTRFEMRRRHFRPSRDLSILIVEHLSQDRIVP